jgi:hypothetical protein
MGSGHYDIIEANFRDIEFFPICFRNWRRLGGQVIKYLIILFLSPFIPYRLLDNFDIQVT